MTKNRQDKLNPAQRLSVNRWIQSLFSIYPRGVHDDDMDDEAVGRALSPPSDEAEEGSASDDGGEEHSVEATTSRGRKLLEIDEDDDEEMGEMVALSEEAEDDIDDDDDDDEEEEEDEPSSSGEDGAEDAEVLSPVKKEKSRGNFGGSRTAAVPSPVQLNQRRKSLQEQWAQDEDTDHSSEGLVEIAMPMSAGGKGLK